jgi:hypothetical protein
MQTFLLANNKLKLKYIIFHCLPVAYLYPYFTFHYSLIFNYLSLYYGIATGSDV